MALLNILGRILELNRKKAFEHTFYTNHMYKNVKLPVKMNSGNPIYLLFKIQKPLSRQCL